MRFLILTQYFAPEPGAAQVRLAAFARELKRLGHEVEIVTAMPNYPLGQIAPEYRGGFYQREMWEGMTLHRVWVYACQGAGIRRLLNYASFALTSIFGLAKATKPDFLFVESPPLLLTIPGFLAAWRWKTSWIMNVADLWPDSVTEMGILRAGWLTRAAYKLESWAYRRSTFVNAVTWGIHQQLNEDKKVPQDKLLFLPNGVDTDLFRPVPLNIELMQRLGLAGKQIVIFPGTHGYAHAMECIVQTALRLRNSIDIHFLLVGSGSAKASLISQAQALGLRNITFLDPVSPEEIPQYMSIAFCGLVTMRDIPLLREARSVKALTIMACGKPLVLAVGRDSGSFVKNAHAGAVVAVDHPDAIADAIVYLKDHPAEAAEHGRNGRAYVCANLQWPDLVRDWLDQLQSRRVPIMHTETYEHSC